MIDLITEYRTKQCPESFVKIYEETDSARQDKLNYYLSKGFCEHDIIEGLDEALIEAVDSWNGNSSGFITFFRNVVDHRVIDARRRTLVKEEWEVYAPDNEFMNDDEDYERDFVEQDIPLEEFPSVEKEVINARIKEKEQRQLFDEILKKTDEQLRQQLLVIAGGRSANYAAQKYGTHHQTLRRKLDRLSQEYNDQWLDLCLYDVI